MLSLCRKSRFLYIDGRGGLNPKVWRVERALQYHPMCLWVAVSVLQTSYSAALLPLSTSECSLGLVVSTGFRRVPDHQTKRWCICLSRLFGDMKNSCLLCRSHLIAAGNGRVHIPNLRQVLYDVRVLVQLILHDTLGLMIFGHLQESMKVGRMEHKVHFITNTFCYHRVLSTKFCLPEHVFHIIAHFFHFVFMLDAVNMKVGNLERPVVF